MSTPWLTPMLKVLRNFLVVVLFQLFKGLWPWLLILGIILFWQRNFAN